MALGSHKYKLRLPLLDDFLQREKSSGDRSLTTVTAKLRSVNLPPNKKIDTQETFSQAGKTVSLSPTGNPPLRLCAGAQGLCGRAPAPPPGRSRGRVLASAFGPDLSCDRGPRFSWDGGGRGDAAVAAAEAASGAGRPGEGSRGEHGRAGLGRPVLGAWGQSGGPGTLRATRGCPWPGCAGSPYTQKAVVVEPLVCCFREWVIHF